MFAKNPNKQKASPCIGNCIEKIIKSEFVKLKPYRKGCKTWK